MTPRCSRRRRLAGVVLTVAAGWALLGAPAPARAVPGAEMVKDIADGARGSQARRPVVFGSTLMFLASNGAGLDGLWRSDGTPSGTVPLRSMDVLEMRTAGGLHRPPAPAGRRRHRPPLRHASPPRPSR